MKYSTAKKISNAVFLSALLLSGGNVYAYTKISPPSGLSCSDMSGRGNLGSCSAVSVAGGHSICVCSGSTSLPEPSTALLILGGGLAFFGAGYLRKLTKK